MQKIMIKKRAGLTLLEMMVALCIGLIVLMTIAIILLGGQRSMDRTLQQANLQRDASQTMLKMKHFIRTAASAEVNPDANELTIYYAGGWAKFRFIRTQKDLRFQLEGEEEQTLLDGIVDSTAFEIDPANNKAVNVELQLQNGAGEIRLLSTTMMRNHITGT
jgi:type II secretory pathway component PulJ